MENKKNMLQISEFSKTQQNLKRKREETTILLPYKKIKLPPLKSTFSRHKKIKAQKIIGSGRFQENKFVDSLLDESLKNTKMKKLAILIDNSIYENFPILKSPPYDSKILESYFKKEGFLVKRYENVKKDFLHLDLSIFNNQLFDSIFIYYAGHGVSIGKNTYCLPVDCKEGDALIYEGDLIENFKSLLYKKNTSQLILVLDCCREENLKFIPKKQAKLNFYDKVLYSCSIGEKAIDGKRSSVFVEWFEKMMMKKNAKFNLKELGNLVYSNSYGKQTIDFFANKIEKRSALSLLSKPVIKNKSQTCPNNIIFYISNSDHVELPNISYNIPDNFLFTKYCIEKLETKENNVISFINATRNDFIHILDEMKQVINREKIINSITLVISAYGTQVYNELYLLFNDTRKADTYPSQLKKSHFSLGYMLHEIGKLKKDSCPLITIVDSSRVAVPEKSIFENINTWKLPKESFILFSCDEGEQPVITEKSSFISDLMNHLHKKMEFTEMIKELARDYSKCGHNLQYLSNLTKDLYFNGKDIKNNLNSRIPFILNSPINKIEESDMKILSEKKLTMINSKFTQFVRDFCYLKNNEGNIVRVIDGSSILSIEKDLEMLEFELKIKNTSLIDSLSSTNGEKFKFSYLFASLNDPKYNDSLMFVFTKVEKYEIIKEYLEYLPFHSLKIIVTSNDDVPKSMGLKMFYLKSKISIFNQ